LARISVKNCRAEKQPLEYFYNRYNIDERNVGGKCVLEATKNILLNQWLVTVLNLAYENTFEKEVINCHLLVFRTDFSSVTQNLTQTRSSGKNSSAFL
jgi:hypothetical protein